jgi:hypothetical protein
MREANGATVLIALTLNYHDQRLRKENWAPTRAETSAGLGQTGGY